MIIKPEGSHGKQPGRHHIKIHRIVCQRAAQQDERNQHDRKEHPIGKRTADRFPKHPSAQQQEQHGQAQGHRRMPKELNDKTAGQRRKAAHLQERSQQVGFIEQKQLLLFAIGKGKPVHGRLSSMFVEAAR